MTHAMRETAQAEYLVIRAAEERQRGQGRKPARQHRRASARTSLQLVGTPASSRASFDRIDSSLGVGPRKEDGQMTTTTAFDGGETGILSAPSLVARKRLFDQLSAGERQGVTLVSAPAGSGKTVLLGSWLEHANLGDRTAWVSVERGEQDA
jgi:hypothetical protein